MHEVLVNRSGGLSLSRKSVVRLTDRPDMTLDVYRGRKTTTTQQQPVNQRRLHTTTQRVPNVHGVLTTLGSRCTNVAGSLGFSPPFHPSPTPSFFVLYSDKVKTLGIAIHLRGFRGSHVPYFTMP